MLYIHGATCKHTEHLSHMPPLQPLPHTRCIQNTEKWFSITFQDLFMCIFQDFPGPFMSILGQHCQAHQSWCIRPKLTVQPVDFTAQHTRDIYRIKTSNNLLNADTYQPRCAASLNLCFLESPGIIVLPPGKDCRTTTAF